MQYLKSIIFVFVFIFSINVYGSDDELCERLVQFSNSAKLNEPLSVYVVTDWSNFTKSCTKTDGNEAEGKFCKWLIQNISMEFMHTNVGRVMQCLSDEQNQFLSKTLQFYSSTGEFIADDAPGIDTDVQVKVSYSFGIEGNLPNLKISTERLKY